MPKAKEQTGPQPPKKPLSAYFIYSQEQRPKLNTTSITESAKILSEQWNGLSSKEKDVYEQKAKTLKSKYEEDKKEYEAKYGAIPKKTRKTTTKEKGEKKPLSAYLRFANEKRQELKDQGLSFTEVGKIIGQAWRDLPDDKKKVYQDQYEQEKKGGVSAGKKVDDDEEEDEE